ncbi:baseplate J-like protein [Peptoanaerobacter stomatis]|uniref:Baseplate J-like protein n=1 Tax=Peptoanaerobacter stomatis TaxID=796937 RepID=J5WM03_9FIRM|nr:baseplate J/gp47 family protein [Peptoanaerobacter stomatis]EJU22942.1 baseplate J-like protein [Peptoanaerobacter stomatis]
MFGLSEKGFKRKLYSDIENDLFIRAKDMFGNDINLSERSPLGIFLRVIAWSLSLIWQVAEKTYHQGHLSSAEGLSLDYVCEKADIYRFPALKATGEVKFTGKAGKKIYKGFKVATNNNVVYETVEEVQISSDGTVKAKVICTQLGDIGNVDANTIKTIINPELDIDSVNNTERFLTGREVETDDELRDRYKLSFIASGKATINAIIAHLLKIPTLKGYKVLENDTMEVKNNMQPKSIKVIALGGTDEEIGRAIFESKAAGIQTNGNVTYMATDNLGYKHEIKFSRASEVSIFAKIDITFNITTINKDELKKEVISRFKKYIRSINMGDTVIISKIISAILSEDIKDVDVMIGKSNASLARSNITLLDEEVPTVMDENITINEV